MAMAALAQAPANLAQMVPVVGIRADGKKCAGSPFSISDPAPGVNGSLEDVVGIAVIRKGRDIVGYIYRMASGKYYAQALETMPYRDQVLGGVVVGPTPKEPHPIIYSRLKRISRFPWSDLTALPCSF